MSRRLIIFASICFLFISCANKKNYIDRGPTCAGVIPVPPKTEVNRAVTIIQLGYVIKNVDTLIVKELFCQDSLRFRRTLAEIELDPLCTELGIQENIYFSTMINNNGSFESIIVRRPVNSCFNKLVERIKLQVGQMVIIEEEYFNSQLEFCFKVRIQ